MSLHGGYIFKNFEGPAKPLLHELPVPEKIFISLSDGIYASFSSLVNEGDTVLAGSRLLKSETRAECAVMAPINGTVTSIDDHGITIASDGTEKFELVKGSTRAPWNLNREAVFNQFCSSGCILLLNGTFSSLKDFDSVKHIIINAVHNSPLNQSWNPGLTGDLSFCGRH